MTELGECRCCRAPIPRVMLACNMHWKMLPRELQWEIIKTHRNGDKAAYVANVSIADKLWQERGIWRPGEPK